MNSEAATPVAAKPASVTPAAHPQRRQRRRRLRRDDSAHNQAAAACPIIAPAAGDRDARPPAAPEAAAAATSGAEAWPQAATEATAALADSTEAGAPAALEAATDSTDDGAPAARGATAAAVGSTDARASAAPEAAADGMAARAPATSGAPAAAAGSIDTGPPPASEATSVGSTGLLPPSDPQTAAAAADNAGAACTPPDAAQRAALEPRQPRKDTAAGVGAQHQPHTSLTGCGMEEQADRLPSMELAHNLLNTGGSEALLTSGESEQWDAELLTGRGRSRDSSLDGAWEALLGLTVSGAPRDSLDERHAPQEAAGRRLNGGMMFPAEGDAFPDEPRLGALAIVRRSLDQVGAECAGCYLSCFWDLRQLDHTCLMLLDCVLICLHLQVHGSY